MLKESRINIAYSVSSLLIFFKITWNKIGRNSF